MLNFNAFAFQLDADLGDACAARDASELGAQRAALVAGLLKADRSMPELVACALEVNKAQQMYVEVETEAGPTRIPVPAGARDVFTSPHREQWMAADQRALDSLLLAGNYFRRVRDVKKEGGRIFKCVVAHKLKIDKKTKKLLDLNGFKSRINLSGDQQTAVLAALGELPPRMQHAVTADDVALKFAFSIIVEYRLRYLTADLPNAYCSAERRRPAMGMELPETVAREDEDGEPLCLWLVTPIYGEAPSGDELDATLSSELEQIGWTMLDVCPAMHTIITPSGAPCVLLRIVDDFLVAWPDGTEYGERTAEGLQLAFGSEEAPVTVHYDSLDIAGYCSTHCRVTNALTVRMNVHVENAVARFEPGILKGVKPSHELKTQSRKGALARLCEGLYLPADRTAKLTGDQVFVQQVTGALKYPERVKPRLTWFLWRLARVMIYPWPIADAAMAARLLLELAYDYIDEGLTWGGAGVEDNPRVLVHMHGELDLDKPPPVQTEAHADTTWNCDPDCFAVVITRYGGLLAHGVWKLAMLADSSALSEAMGSSHAAEKVMVVREMERGVGIHPEGPAVITTDSTSNWQVATRHASANRARHALRRWKVLGDRIKAKDAKLVHIPGLSTPADIFTKKSDAKRVNIMLAFLMNAANVVGSNAAKTLVG